MFKKTMLITALGLIASTASAVEVPISGTVESRCIISTENPGTYGNPNAYTLTTSLAEGGEPATVRFDVSLADAYYAEITVPSAFSSSPTLPDVVYWAGDVTVSAISDATGMGQYETNKIEYGYTDKYELTATGSTWFEINSTATMGGNRAFPGGNYTAVAEAVCVAQ